MHQYCFSALFILFLLFLLPHQSHAQGLITSLKVTVVDDMGKPQAKSIVKLYSKSDDYEANQNQVYLKEANSRGIVSFVNIEAATFFIRAENGKKNNDQSVTSFELNKNKLNELIIIIKEGE